MKIHPIDKLIVSCGHGGNAWGVGITPWKGSPTISPGEGFEEGVKIRQIVHDVCKRFDPNVVLDLNSQSPIDISIRGKADCINKIAAEHINVGIIELHTNAIDEDQDGKNEWDSASGAIAWHYPGSTGGAMMAGIFRDTFPKAAGMGIRRQGVAAGKFGMLRLTDPPAMLGELGFHNNIGDVERLQNHELVTHAVELTFKRILGQ